MAGTLRDTHPLVAEILDGKYDEVLEHVERAAKIRLKQRAARSGLRKGTRIVIGEAALEQAPDFVGRKGVVDKVNPKTIGVELDKLHDNDCRTSWRVPHSWVEPDVTP
jgi:hypothetical protein